MQFFGHVNKNGSKIPTSRSIYLKHRGLTKNLHGSSGVLCLRSVFKSICFMLLLLNRYRSYVNTCALVTETRVQSSLNKEYMFISKQL